MSQKTRPDYDLAVNGWAPTPLFAQLNEPEPDDGSYVTSPDLPPGRTFVVRLAARAAPLAGPPARKTAARPHCLTVRVRRGQNLNAVVTLMQQTEAGVNRFIASRSFALDGSGSQSEEGCRDTITVAQTASGGGGYADCDVVLTRGEAARIEDYARLVVMVTVFEDGASSSSSSNSSGSPSSSSSSSGSPSSSSSSSGSPSSSASSGGSSSSSSSSGGSPSSSSSSGGSSSSSSSSSGSPSSSSSSDGSSSGSSSSSSGSPSGSASSGGSASGSALSGGSPSSSSSSSGSSSRSSSSRGSPSGSASSGGSLSSSSSSSGSASGSVSKSGVTCCLCSNLPDTLSLTVSGCFDESPITTNLTRDGCTWSGIYTGTWDGALFTIYPSFGCCDAIGGCIDAEGNSFSGFYFWQSTNPQGLPCSCCDQGGGGMFFQLSMAGDCCNWTSISNWYFDICPSPCSGTATVSCDQKKLQKSQSGDPLGKFTESPSASVPCRYLGEELLGGERAERGLPHGRKWQWCEHPQRVALGIAEAVCRCRECGPGCQGYTTDS